MTHTHRSTDRDFVPTHRSERFYLESGLWYFHTREGTPIGPFRYRSEAEAMLKRFIDRILDDEQQLRTRSMKRKPHFRTSALI